MLQLRIAILAIASMFWPLLLVVVIIALESSRPARILVWFYAGGFTTATSVGIAMVFVLEGSPLMTGSRLPSDPWVDAASGVLALVLAAMIRRADRRRARRRAADDGPKPPSSSKERIQHLVERGGPLAFAGGVVGSVVPSPLVIVAMADIAQLGHSNAGTVAVVLIFFAIVFAFIEIPITGYVSAPERTRTLSLGVKAWIDRNLWALAFWALALAGTFQFVRGVVVVPFG